jgi:predicted O-methyltransferase YrrM
MAVGLESYLRNLRRRFGSRNPDSERKSSATELFPPGHFYSPLIDVSELGPNDSSFPFDGPEWWESVDLRPAEQRAYYEDLLQRHSLLPFPDQKTEPYHYFTGNGWLAASDAYVLSGIIQKEKPQRIIEVGSGFSSAVMLDTLSFLGHSAALTFIEPNPERLYSLLSPQDKSCSKILVQRVQEIPVSVFDQLDSQDILFIDSSHVAKVGSDVSFLILRILPRLRPGVIVHVHDIFYPYSYPIKWLREGRSWNESLMLRAFLQGNSQFQVLAFNSYAGECFPEVFKDRCPVFLKNTGGSIWMRKVA